jgi:SAM-dependent methyltransferase
MADKFTARCFDSDTAALSARIDANQRAARHDMDDWIADIVEPGAGQRLLDLGCGTGKQVFKFIDRIGPSGHLTAVDVSDDAVELVAARARREGRDNVAVVRAAFDEAPAALARLRFDLIYSAYAIYYATDFAGLICDLRNNLSPNGRVFVCGPGAGTNREMDALVGEFAPDAVKPIDDFAGADAVRKIVGHYAGIEVFRLDNVVTFGTPDDVLQWWRNHNSFVSQVEPQVRERLSKHFSSNREFCLTKSVQGLLINA